MHLPILYEYIQARAQQKYFCLDSHLLYSVYYYCIVYSQSGEWVGYTLLEKFRQISLYVTEDAPYCKALCDEKFSQMEGNGRKFSHIELSNIFISYIF